MKQHFKTVLTGTVILLGITACSGDSDTDTAERDINLTTGNAEPEPGRLGGTMANDYRDIEVEITPYATVVFNAAEGGRASGNVQFVSEESGTRIFGRMANLPEGNHGLLILQSGDCSEVSGVVASSIGAIDSAVDDDGSALSDASSFVGNISVGADNLASFELLVDDLMLEGPNSIIGKPMIVGPAVDEGSGQPTGQTPAHYGNAIACGVVALNDVTAAGPDATNP